MNFDRHGESKINEDEDDCKAAATGIITSMAKSKEFWGEEVDRDDYVPANLLKCPPSAGVEVAAASQVAQVSWLFMTQEDLERIRHLNRLLMENGEVSYGKLVHAMKYIIVKDDDADLRAILSNISDDHRHALIMIANQIFRIFNENEPPVITEDEVENSAQSSPAGNEKRPEKVKGKPFRNVKNSTEHWINFARDNGLGEIRIPSAVYTNERSKLALIQKYIKGRMKIQRTVQNQSRLQKNRVKSGGPDINNYTPAQCDLNKRLLNAKKGRERFNLRSSGSRSQQVKVDSATCEEDIEVNNETSIDLTKSRSLNGNSTEQDAEKKCALNEACNRFPGGQMILRDSLADVMAKTSFLYNLGSESAADTKASPQVLEKRDKEAEHPDEKIYDITLEEDEPKDKDKSFETSEQRGRTREFSEIILNGRFETLHFVKANSSQRSKTPEVNVNTLELDSRDSEEKKVKFTENYPKEELVSVDSLIIEDEGGEMIKKTESIEEDSVENDSESEEDFHKVKIVERKTDEEEDQGEASNTSIYSGDVVSSSKSEEETKSEESSNSESEEQSAESAESSADQILAKVPEKDLPKKAHYIGDNSLLYVTLIIGLCTVTYFTDYGRHFVSKVIISTLKTNTISCLEKAIKAMNALKSKLE